MVMTYPDYVQALVDLMPTTPTDENFLSILPRCIEYAENRIRADLDLIAFSVTNDSATLTANSRALPLPSDQGTFQVIDQVAVFATSGTRTALLPVSRDYLDWVYPSDIAATTPSVPVKFARVDQDRILVGPPPDQAYPVEIIGTVQPAPLSQANQTTSITTLVPQLFVAASMVFMSGFMRDFAPASDDPQLPVTWETQYGKLLSTAKTEEFRKKFMAAGWDSTLPSPMATPPQT